MHILFASEYFPPFTPGGAEWSTLLFAQTLTEAGHTVDVVTVNFGAARGEDMGGVQVHRVPFPFRLSPGQHSAPSYATRNLLFYLYFATFVYAVGRESDVIHAQSSNVVVPSWLAARLAGKRFLVTIRDLGFLCPIGAICLLQQRQVPPDCGRRRMYTTDARFYQRHYLRHQHILSRMKLTLHLAVTSLDMCLKQAALNSADGIISVSRGIAEVYPDRVLRHRELVHIVHNLAPTSVAPVERVKELKRRWQLQDHKVVLTAGKLSLGKGTYILLEAARRLSVTNPDVQFLLAGKGSVRGHIPSNVRLLGSVPQAELMQLYRVADVVVVPSVWPEPLSRVILEAMAAGKPVIGTDVGGTPEIIHNGVTGLIVPAGDAVALVAAIQRLTDDPLLSKRMGEAGRECAAERFGAERLSARLVEIYQKAIQPPG